MKYNWQHEDWPHFRFDVPDLQEKLSEIVRRNGELGGMLKTMPQELQEQSRIDLMVAEALKTSAIEGEGLNREEVLSSIRNNLGLNRFPERVKDKRAAGIARLMVKVRAHFSESLTENMLFEWHQMVMEAFMNVEVGTWRKGSEPMQIISGPIGRETFHFQAPPSDQVAREMKRFISWYNQQANESSSLQSPVWAALVHLYFESIHPFEDGNGRIGRVLAEKALSQGLGQPIIFSLSQAIEPKRKDYYEALKTAQRSMEVSPWVSYFVGLVEEAQQLAAMQMEFTLNKARFFQRIDPVLNPQTAQGAQPDV
jgi:Fic family protein